MILATIILTILAMLAFQKIARQLAVKSSSNDTVDDFYDTIAGLCYNLGWRLDWPEREDVIGLDRYPEDGCNPFTPFVTRIVVPSEYARAQIALALRYLHDSPDTDTDYMAVNTLVHLYADESGEPSGRTPWIVVETPDQF